MSNYKKAIGQKIKRRRIDAGFKSQEALAKEIGVDQSRVARWESGQNIPDPKYRAMLFKALKTDESLFDISVAVSTKKDSLFAAIIARLPALNEDELGAVMGLIDDLATLRRSKLPTFTEVKSKILKANKSK